MDFISVCNFPFNDSTKDGLEQSAGSVNRTYVTHIRDQIYNFPGNVLTANRGGGISPPSGALVFFKYNSSSNFKCECFFKLKC